MWETKKDAGKKKIWILCDGVDPLTSHLKRSFGESKKTTHNLSFSSVVSVHQGSTGNFWGAILEFPVASTVVLNISIEWGIPLRKVGPACPSSPGANPSFFRFGTGKREWA